MRKTIVLQPDPSKPPLTMASFSLDGTSLKCEWADEGFRKDIEERGIIALNGRRVRSADGLRFWDALDRAFDTSRVLPIVIEDSAAS